MEKAENKWGHIHASNCETCEFYDYDEDYDANVCSMKLDEDDMLRFLRRDTAACPYYRYYDEYRSVRRQI